jgi:hypothetical protein
MPPRPARQGLHHLQVENKDEIKSRRLLNTKESLVLLGLLAKGYTVSRQVVYMKQRQSQKSSFIEY